MIGRPTQIFDNTQKISRSIDLEQSFLLHILTYPSKIKSITMPFSPRPTSDDKQALLQELQGSEIDHPSSPPKPPVPSEQNVADGKHALLQELNDDTNFSGAIPMRGSIQMAAADDVDDDLETAQSNITRDDTPVDNNNEQGGDDVRINQAELVDEDNIREQARMEAREEIFKEIVPAEKVQVVNNKKNYAIVSFGVLFLGLVIGLALGLSQKRGDRSGSPVVPTMAPTPEVDHFLYNDVCALAAPVPANAGPEVVYTGDLSNSTFWNESLADIGVLPDYKRWYEFTHVGGMRMTYSWCSRLDKHFYENFNIVVGAVFPFFFEGADGCLDTVEPLIYTFSLPGAFDELIGDIVEYDDFSPLACHTKDIDATPDGSYKFALVMVEYEKDLAKESFFNFSIATNDRCEFAAGISPGIPFSASNKFGSSVTNLPVCNGVDASGKPGTWYKVEGTGETLTASTCQGSRATDTLISVFRSACDNLSCVTANDNANSPNLNCGRWSYVRWTGHVNETYYILVTPGQEEGAQPGEFMLDLKESASENLCTGAHVIDVESQVELTFTDQGDRSWGDDGVLTERCDYSSFLDPGMWLSYVGRGREVRSVDAGHNL